MSYWAQKRVPSLRAELVARLPDDIPRWKVAYWQFQYELTQAFIIPFLRDRSALPRTGRILEVGAGEGGCLAALAETTNLPAEALELSAPRAELGRRLNAVMTDGELNIVVGDIASASDHKALKPPYTLVLLRDVIEHVVALDAALENCRGLLADDGAVLMTFPPYLSPYGAHQQILSRAWMRLPWIQHLPPFRDWVRGKEPIKGKQDEILELGRCRLTLARFEGAVRKAGLDPLAAQRYLIRPAFRYRYGLPVVPAGFLGRMPGLRELVVTGAWYLLRAR